VEGLLPENIRGFKIALKTKAIRLWKHMGRKQVKNVKQGGWGFSWSRRWIGNREKKIQKGLQKEGRTGGWGIGGSLNRDSGLGGKKRLGWRIN